MIMLSPIPLPLQTQNDYPTTRQTIQAVRHILDSQAKLLDTSADRLKLGRLLNKQFTHLVELVMSIFSKIQYRYDTIFLKIYIDTSILYRYF